MCFYIDRNHIDMYYWVYKLAFSGIVLMLPRGVFGYISYTMSLIVEFFQRVAIIVVTAEQLPLGANYWYNYVWTVWTTFLWFPFIRRLRARQQTTEAIYFYTIVLFSKVENNHFPNKKLNYYNILVARFWLTPSKVLYPTFRNSQ